MMNRLKGHKPLRLPFTNIDVLKGKKVPVVSSYFRGLQDLLNLSRLDNAQSRGVSMSSEMRQRVVE